MTPISTFYGISAPPSPRSQMNERISAAVSAGTISSTDQTALSGALDTIDSSLAATRGSKDSPASIKEKIDSLIDEQVSGGTLNDKQATELKNLFVQDPKAAGRPEAGGSEANDNGTGGRDGGQTSEQLDAMAGLLGKLQGGFTTRGPYGANGITTTSAPTSGLVMDQRA